MCCLSCVDAVPLHAVRNMDGESVGGRSETSVSGKKEPGDGKDGAENHVTSSVPSKARSNGSSSSLPQLQTRDGDPSTLATEHVAAANDEQKQQEGATKDPRENLLAKDNTRTKEKKQSGEEKQGTEGGQTTGSSDNGSGVKDKTRGQQSNHLNNGDGGGERHKAEGTKVSISEGGEMERAREVGSGRINGGDNKTKREDEDGGQTDHLCSGDGEEKSKGEGEEKNGERNQKKAVSPPTSVVTTPPKQPKNLKVRG